MTATIVSAPSQRPPSLRVSPAVPFLEFTPSDLEQSVPARFEQIVQKHPQRPAFKTSARVLTYDGLNRAANGLARTLLARRGSESEPVALVLPDRTDAIIGILGVLKAGKFYASLDPETPDAHLEVLLRDLDAALIVTDMENVARLRTLVQGTSEIVNIDALDGNASEANVGLLISPDAIQAVVYTSGSTGTPKGVVHNHRSVLHSVAMHTNYLHMNADDRTLVLGSPVFNAATAKIYATILNGGLVYATDVRRDGIGDLAALIAREEITNFHAVPSLFRQIIALFDRARAPFFPTMRLVCLSGEAVLKTDIDAYKTFFPVDCIARVSLGTTETHAFTFYLLDKNTPITQRIVPVGYVLDGYQVTLLDEQGEPVGEDTPGELVVQSRFIAEGYWRQPELTERMFTALPSGERAYRTGDLGRMNRDGLVEHLGRKDLQLKIRGFRVEPDEIQAVLLEHSDIRDAAVVARENDQGSRSLAAYVVPAPGAALAASAMRAYLKTRLPDYMIPSMFVILTKLPTTANGKLDRSQLPIPVDTRPAVSRDTGEDEIAALLVTLWQAVLGVSNVGVRDDFFDLGGESLHAARIVAEIDKRFRVKFQPTIFVEASTPGQLAVLIREGTRAPAESLIVPLVPEGSKAPLFFAPGYGGGVVDYAPAAQLLHADRPVYGIRAAAEEEFDPDFETMVQRYVQELRTFQPQGPYLIGGYSYGGAVAYEMAQQLMAQGEHVSYLLLLDYWANEWRKQPRKFNIAFARGFINNFPFWLDEFLELGPRGMRLRIQRKIRVISYRLRGEDPLMVRPEDIVDDIGNVDAAKLAFMAHESRIFRRYTTRPYPGRITVVSARAQSLFGPFDPDLGWERYAPGRVQVLVIPSSHNTLLKQANAPALASLIRASLPEP